MVIGPKLNPKLAPVPEREEVLAERGVSRVGDGMGKVEEVFLKSFVSQTILPPFEVTKLV